MSCNKPLSIVVNGTEYPIPCRWCLGCRIDRRNEWNNRIRWHAAELNKHGFRSSFVTLTYDDNHYRGGVCKYDIVSCIKRLRKYLYNNKDILNCKDFKYYIVSEFGSKTERGHYHGIFLGLESSFLKEFLRKAWRNGFIDVKPLIPARISYTLKYMDKQQFGERVKESQLRDIVDFPFVLCSKGIGAGYLKEMFNTCSDGYIYSNGRKIPFPKYYAKKFGLDMSGVQLDGREKTLRSVKNEKMTLKEYTLKNRYANESRLATLTHQSGACVDSKALRVCSALLEKSNNEGENLAKELNYENE